MQIYRQLAAGILLSGLMMGSAIAAASQNDNDPLKTLPPKDSVKLSTVIATAEKRPGFYAIKSIDYSDGDYHVVYFMNDGAEVRIDYDAKTGQGHPPKSSGLFGD
ncbi:PepSY domain-containing protein [Jiella mangrovi]|uniref:PepSY domain-containing protein n=1 Tax=Jiella mangrovi TaxID=2821407 RepID=A0ABS4BII0_9HYPH|nr:PepSY domain-containing protein [Jiella mangrovi]MBP0616575.1 PepSY domain-containing protein [Jiella mangrovi]